MANFLMALIGPLAKKLLISLGFALVSYAALISAVNAAIAAVKLSYSGISADVLSLIELAAVDNGIGIILGAIVARVSFAYTTKLALK